MNCKFPPPICSQPCPGCYSTGAGEAQKGERGSTQVGAENSRGLVGPPGRLTPRSKVQLALADFWERQQARARHREELTARYAGRYPLNRVVRRPLDPRQLFAEATMHQHLEIRRVLRATKGEHV